MNLKTLAVIFADALCVGIYFIASVVIASKYARPHKCFIPGGPANLGNLKKETTSPEPAAD